MIYLDNAATTLPSKTSFEKAKIFLEEKFYNPSALYKGGLDAFNEIKASKEYILKSLGGTNHQIIFTSCGSESDNLAIFGAVKRGGFLTDQGEHSAVYKSFLELKNKGQNIYFCELNNNGSANIENLLNIVSENKIDFVSIMHVNNETGAINDVNLIAKKVKEINPKIVFHVDGVQAYGKIPYRISNDIDLYSISAHKINALKGTGALIRKKGTTLNPIIFGGGQEEGLRSGTENVFGIKFFEYSAREHYENLQNYYDRVKEFNEYFRLNILKDNTVIITNGLFSPYIFTFSCLDIKGEILMHELESKGIIVGNGSACSSKNRFSRVIEACGYKNYVLDGVVRISFSPYLTMDEIKFAVQTINDSIINLRRKMNK